MPSTEVAVLDCPAGQIAYEAEITPGTYVDLVPDGTAACGTAPSVCLGAFRSYIAANDPSDSAVFEQLAAAARKSAVRLFAANNLVDARPHLFIGSASSPELVGAAWVPGCAAETQVRGRPSILTIQSIAVGGITP